MTGYRVPALLVRIAIPLAWLAWVLTFAQNLNAPSGVMAFALARCAMWASLCHCGLAGMKALYDIASSNERIANAAEKRGSPVKAPAFNPPP
ncbi:hypothetical protein [Methylibium sp.]|uniref:hypothetical protein n=1 Tax=Methylibium sp. TaxID=2067992 RepID=UPI00185BC33E|nr:hypothetical protein [Methylibium sp.]MBA3588858.1 hypothetical protein [Methylibium sp.]